MWYWWYVRNKLLYKGQTLEIQSCHLAVLKLLSDFEEANKIDHVSIETSSPAKYLPPDVEVIKFNSDAALKPNVGTGLGIVAWDSSGRMLVAKMVHDESILDPEMVDARALLVAAHLADTMQLEQVMIFESECLPLIQCLQNARLDHSPMGLVISDILSLCHVFSSFSFHFKPRTVNKVVHSLAQLAFNCSCLDCFFSS